MWPSKEPACDANIVLSLSFQVSIVLEILQTIWISHVQSVITVQKEQRTCLTTHVQREHSTHINIEQMTRHVRVAHQECTAWDLG